MSFRIEKKYKLTKSDKQLLQFQLYGSGAKILYPPRKVNSCYLDTNDLASFYDSEEGSLPRRKIRIRWYNNHKELFKETKTSSVEGRFKTVNEIKIKDFFKDFKYQFYDSKYGMVKSKLIISYQREYLSYKGIRITFDTSINYLDLNGISRRNFVDTNNVMEIKSSINTPDDFLNNIIDMPTCRFSKYCRGTLLLNKSN